MKAHSKKILDELCNYLGQDVDHPMCKELTKHVHDCPECQFYIDTVKMTVNVFRETHPSKPVPGHVKKRLLTTINLKEK